MATEIERRFIIKADKLEDLLLYCIQRDAYSVDITQGYIPTADPAFTCRIRLRSERGAKEGFMTMKCLTHTSGVNLELERSIRAAEAEEFLANIPDRISKTRVVVPIDSSGDLSWEIDFFKGEFSGIIVAEIELNDLDQILHLPSFLGPEITHIASTSNRHMCLNTEQTLKTLRKVYADEL